MDATAFFKSDDFGIAGIAELGIPHKAIHSETMIHCDSIVKDKAD